LVGTLSPDLPTSGRLNKNLPYAEVIEVPGQKTNPIAASERKNCNSMDTFYKEFNDHFTIMPATDAQLIAECQRLRYQVFCTEHSIFSGDLYTGELERDEFDQHSVHSLLFHRATGSTVATVRLVLANPHRPEARFPLETHLGRYIYADPASFHRAPRASVAEISRLAVSKQFRHRVGERQQAYNNVEEPSASESRRGNRLYPHITLGLFKAIVQMSVAHDVRFWCAAMEPTLMRLLSRFGIRFSPIGPLTEYYGLRQPCSASVHDILSGIHARRLDVWRFITDDGQLHPELKVVVR
jgi:N-acyl amino acid synthase of PEP-CTERM/exosortase system